MIMEWLWPLAGFATVSCITPGPNNLLLTQSGARFGFRRSVPHVCGIAAGMGVMLLAVAGGLGSLFSALPWLQPLLRLGGTLYLLWLGYLVATAPPLSREDDATTGVTPSPGSTLRQYGVSFVKRSEKSSMLFEPVKAVWLSASSSS